MTRFLGIYFVFAITVLVYGIWVLVR